VERVFTTIENKNQFPNIYKSKTATGFGWMQQTEDIKVTIIDGTEEASEYFYKMFGAMFRNRLQSSFFASLKQTGKKEHLRNPETQIRFCENPECCKDCTEDIGDLTFAHTVGNDNKDLVRGLAEVHREKHDNISIFNLTKISNDYFKKQSVHIVLALCKSCHTSFDNLPPQKKESYADSIFKCRVFSSC